MTASFKLRKRMEDAKTWSFGAETPTSMSGMDNSYVRPFGECHPDFYAIPIGQPWGVKMCVRRPMVPEAINMVEEEQKEKGMRDRGYWRAAVNLYDPEAKEPTQLWNPLKFQNRRIPYETELLEKDYIRGEIEYSGTGINPTTLPTNDRHARGKPYYQYGYDFTPHSDVETGYRSATRQEQSVPPKRFDITRLNQPFDIWKRRQEIHGNTCLDHWDKTHFDRDV